LADPTAAVPTPVEMISFPQVLPLPCPVGLKSSPMMTVSFRSNF